MSAERYRVQGAGFEGKPGAKTRSHQMDEDREEKKEPAAKLYKYHHLLLGQWFHSLYQKALINTQRTGNVTFTGMPMPEYYDHLNRLSDESGITTFDETGIPHGQVGVTLYDQFSDTAYRAALDTWSHLPSTKEYDVVFKPEFLFRPTHALRVQQLYGNELLREYVEQEGYGSLPELIADFVTDPEATLPANGNGNGGRIGDLNLEQMYAMLRGKKDTDIDKYSDTTGNRHLQLMQLLAYASSYYFFDFKRDGKIDLADIDQRLHRAVLSASARADMVGLFTEKRDTESAQLVSKFMTSIEDDKISPYAFASMDESTIDQRVKMIDKIRSGHIRLAVIEAKTELRDQRFDEKRGRYVDRTFNREAIPAHHHEDFGFTIFAMYQHAARLLNIRPEDIAQNRGLIDFQTGSRHNPEERQRYRNSLNSVRKFRDSFFGPNTSFVVTRVFGNTIDAVEADMSLLKTAKPSKWYGLKADRLSETTLEHSVLPADKLLLRKGVLNAGNKLVRNINDRMRPLTEDTLRKMLEETI